MGKFEDLTGKRFGYLIAEARDTSCIRRTVYRCKCDCGNTKVVSATHLVGGKIISCGCYRKKNASRLNKKHGDSTESSKYARLFRIWGNMKSRCTNPNVPCYRYYGGKGVTVCDEWINSYSEFKKWAIENGYTDRKTIDRLDSNGGYTPDNCRWVSFSENSSRMASLGDDVKAEIVRLYKSGKQQSEIANALGVSTSTVSKVCVKNKLNKRRLKHSDEKISEIVRLRKLGLSLGDISRIVGVSKSYVSTYVIGVYPDEK